MAKNKSLSGAGNYGASIGQGASIADMAYGKDASAPSQHDNDAELYSSFERAFSAPGDRPRGIWRNFGAGLAKGAAHNARSKAIDEKKGKNEKFQKVMDYFQQANQSAMEQNKWHAEREQKLETIKPFAMGGLEVSYSGMDYATGNERMRNIMEQAKIADPSIKGDYVGYVPNSPIVNMRDENGNIIAMSLSTLVGEDSVKRVQGNYIDQQGRDVAQQKEDREERYAPEKYAAMEERAKNAAERTRQMSQKTYMSALEKYGPKMEAASRVRVVASKMKDLIAKNPDMFQSVLSVVWDNPDPGVLQILAQKFSNGQKAETIKEMGKYIQELKIGIIKGLAKPNQAIDLIAAGTVPGKGMPDNSILKILDDLDYKAEHEIDINRDYLNEVKGAFGEDRNGGDVYKEKAEGYIAGALKPKAPPPPNPEPGATAIPQSTVIVRNPETGAETEIDEKQLDAAIEAHYEYVGVGQNGN